MTDTPIDRESVERLAREMSALGSREAQTMPQGWSDAYDLYHDTRDTLLALRAALDAAEEEIKRLRQLIPRPDQTKDELIWRDYMRGVPLAALAKEFGVTKERMRHRLRKISERKLHMTENPDG